MASGERAPYGSGPRTKLLSLVLRDDELDELSELAGIHGVTRHAMVRSWVRTKLARERRRAQR